MSRSRKQTPICGMTNAESEAEDKAIWHRRYRRAEDARLKHEGAAFIEHTHHAHSDTWTMDKDGKQYFDAAQYPREMRK